MFLDGRAPHRDDRNKKARDESNSGSRDPPPAAFKPMTRRPSPSSPLVRRRCRSTNLHLRMQPLRPSLLFLVIGVSAGLIIGASLVLGYSLVASVGSIGRRPTGSIRTSSLTSLTTQMLPSASNDGIHNIDDGGGNDDSEGSGNGNHIKDETRHDDDESMICAAVLVPGFLTGAAEFEPMCKALSDRGLPTVSIPMPNWHWLPCLGGRSARPILERIDFTVKHLIANDGDVTKIPPYQYTLADTWRDFRNNPGGIFEVGGSSRVDDYPTVEPQGRFPLPERLPKKKVALIGHR
jgi:hypothetical protein